MAKTLNWNQATAKFAEALPGFQRRDNQDNLAVRIETCMEFNSHLFAQAGCGTGKSFAGLIPAIKHSIDTGRPVILATATKALQDQYAGKDLPFIQQHLYPEITNLFTVLKGRSNYVCLAKVEEIESASYKTQLKAEVEAEDFNGEIERIQLTLTPQEKAGLATTAEECPGKKECPFGEVCFAEKAKERAKTSKIVVVNHAVLAADLSIKLAQKLNGVPEDKVTGLMPQFGGVVVDEAHELVEFVTNALGGEITGGSYGRLGSRVTNLLADPGAAGKINQAADSLFREVTNLLARRADKRSKTVSLTDETVEKLAPKIKELATVLKAVETQVKAHVIHGNDTGLQKKNRLVKLLGNAANKLLLLVLAADEDLVRWIEQGEGKKGDTIKWAPLSVANFLREELLSKAPVTFMSATLAIGNDFSSLANQIGVDDFEAFDAGTPFDFTKQARTFIPQLAVPAGATLNQWRTGSIATMGELIKASNGRALLLFTSRVEMEEAHSALAPIVENLGHRALLQGTLPNRELKDIFDADEHSVLFAMKSFMTGIDIQGDSLRLVVINKLPFTNPSDVIFDARCKALDAQFGAWSGFNKLSVPTMALTLLQAYGRLIRTVNDNGVVAILDSRLHGKNQKNYGAKIMRALPNAPVITDLGEAVDYLESLEGVPA